MNWLYHSASYCSIFMGLFAAVILYRSEKYKAKGMSDPWRPYLYTGLILVTIFACVGFVLLTSHR
jgi:hypothetical protein